MKRERFSEEQILEILKAGQEAADLRAFCDAQNIRERTYRVWLASHAAELAAANEPQRPSRSERTRDIKAINRLGLELVALSQLKLDRIELPEELRSSIEACRTLTKGALGRQKRLVCKVLRSEDHEAIRKQVESL
jgi:ribosomal 50S subunit-associated protein YjgA (DUF615 family)